MAQNHNVYGARLVANELIGSIGVILNEEDSVKDRSFEEMFDCFDHLQRVIHVTKKSYVRSLQKRIIDLEYQLKQGIKND